MSWEGDITDRLRVHKIAGLEFREAWLVALEEVPPRGRYLGPVQPELDSESIVLFMERVCRDAWHDLRPMLRHLPALMEQIGVDGSSYARPSGRSRTMKKTAA